VSGRAAPAGAAAGPCWVAVGGGRRREREREKGAKERRAEKEGRRGEAAEVVEKDGGGGRGVRNWSDLGIFFIWVDGDVRWIFETGKTLRAAKRRGREPKTGLEGALVSPAHISNLMEDVDTKLINFKKATNLMVDEKMFKKDSKILKHKYYSCIFHIFSCYEKTIFPLFFHKIKNYFWWDLLA
jgi:hypothetical protein